MVVTIKINIKIKLILIIIKFKLILIIIKINLILILIKKTWKKSFSAQKYLENNYTTLQSA